MKSIVGRLGRAQPAKAILLAPVVFIAHVMEEAPGFVPWFNSLVQPGINQRLFLTVNVVAFLITVLLAALTATVGEKGLAHLTLGWLSFLMFANAVLHIAGTIVHRRYSPGTITAAAVYLPYFSWFLLITVRRFNLKLSSTALTVILGSSLMLIHGYLIVFEGRRLF